MKSETNRTLLKVTKTKSLKSLLIAIGLLITSINTAWATTWTVAASSTQIINGSSTWSPSTSSNDLTNVSGNYWALEVTGKSPTTSSFEFKICQDHAWGTSYPTNNYSFSNVATGSGTTILYTFNSSSHDIKAYGFKTWRVAGTSAATGSDWDISDTNNNMSKGGNVYTYTLTKKNMALSSGTTYEFKVVKDGAWAVAFPTSNKTFTVATTGRYDITYSIDLSTQTVSVSTTPSTYTITLNGNGGSGHTSSVTATYNSSTLASITNPTKTGYTFAGWYTGSGGTGTLVINTSGVLQANVSNYTGAGGKWVGTEAKTLYAKWTAKTYSITLDDNGDYQGNGSATATYGNTTLTVSSHAERDDWNLVGYWTASGSGGSQVSDASGNLIASVSGYTDSNGKWIKDATCSLYAHWSQTNSLTVAAGDHISIVTGTISPVTLGNSYAISASGFASGYEFNNWTADPVANGSFASSTSASTNVTVNNGSVTVTANARPITYTISYNLDGGTNYVGAPTNYNIETETIVLGTPTKSHYHFEGWTNAGGSSVTSIPLGSTGNITLTAHWTALPKVYLKNTMNWATAYVTFYKGEYWDTSNGAGSSRSSDRYVADPAAMTYNSATGLFEYECPDATAFVNKTYRYAAFTKDKQDDYGNFWSTEAVYFNNNFRYDSVAVVAAQTSVLMNSETVKYYTTKTNGNLEYVTLTAGEGTGWFIPGGWSSWETKTTEFSWNSTNVRFTKSLSANTSYEFKIYNCGVYYGNSGTYSASGSKTFTDGASNCSLSTTLAGTYTFDFNTSTKSLTITYPEVYAVSGGFNSWTEETNLAFSGNDGTYSVTIDGDGTNYEFKVIDNAVWYGHANKTFTATESNVSLATGSNNIKLKADVYPNGSYTFAYNKSTHKLGVTYPTSYTVTFGKSTGGGNTTATANSTAITSGKKIVSGATVVFTKGSTSSGYTFKGWYNNSAGTGDKLVAGTPDTYTISSLGAAATVYAVYTPNNYTVSFDATTNGGTCGTASTSVTYAAAYGELPTATHASKVFKGWYTLSSGGTQVTASTTVSRAENHTLYAQYEDIYDVTIQYKSGDVTLRSNSATTASATAMAADISAPEILGYEFSNWTGSNATFGNASSATTTVKASASTTITANYTAIPTVYFKNNLGWEHVYVTFDNTWVSDAPCNNGKPYFEMTQLGTSDIFSCRIPDDYVTSNYASWAWNIAFDNHGFSASENVGTFSGGFNAGEFLGRGDFDPSATMFIPYDGDSETRNGGTYYRTGCWMKYNSTDPGYKIYANTYVTGSGGDVVEGTPVLLTADIAGGFEFKATVNFPNAKWNYGFILHKEKIKNTNAEWYTNRGAYITSATTTLPWDFTSDENDANKRCGITTEALGDYEFTVSFGTGKPMVNVTYPVSVGDWRLAYNDRVAWSGSAHAADWYLYSRVIKAEANAEDIVSFYVSKAVGANAHIELQKCTAINALTGAETWEKQGSNLDISAITATGIYNFKVTQNGSKVASAAYDGSYDGNFYIRTDASDGGWSNYKTSGTNTMTYSEYAADNHGFTHYFMRYVTKDTNIRFCIANDYSPCLTEYCINDDYTDEWLEANGNVRFMWNHKTNAVSRAYISGSSEISDRFLVLEGDDKMFDAEGNALAITGLNANEMNFTDDQNWIYEATVKAKPGARIKLTAKFNNEIQYFYGKEGARSTETTDLLLGGSGTEKYKVRIVYDFKTNRLMKAFMPEGDIDTDLAINADLMIVREAQGDAQQITFGANGALSEVKTVYGAMKFNKYNVNNKSKEGGHGNLGWSQYKRDLFYISFPFDVKLSDVFGFGTYGKHWIIEYYDGKGRAANGFWADSPSNWKFVMPSQRSSFTLKANEGYILALDLDEMTESSSIWNNDVQDVYVYFPSNGNVNDIEATNKLVTIDQEGYQCTIGPRFSGGDDRRTKDSYWHCIGVPSFANYSRDLKDTEGGTTIDWRNTSMPYLYEWNSTNNTLSITSSATFSFKPMYSYMVQYAGTSIYWSEINSTPSSVVARQKDVPRDIEFRMELQQGEQKADQAFVRLTDDEHVTTGYDFNYDLSKEFNKGIANIYTMISSVIDNEASVTEAAGNVLPMSEQTTVVPVGVKVVTNDDYTFSIPEGTDGVGVTLIDTETGIRTVLSAVDYTVSLEAGTYDNRFVLEISPIRNMPTELETSDNDAAIDGVRKLLIDGLLYIVRDGKVYDARGARVE